MRTKLKGAIAVIALMTIPISSVAKTYEYSMPVKGMSKNPVDRIFAELTVDKEKIRQGESITLDWRTAYAPEVTLSPLGPVDKHGSATLSPTQSTTYTLKAFGSKYYSDELRHVLVEVLKPFPEVAIASSKASIFDDQSVRLAWSSKNANSLSISDVGSVPLEGYKDVSPKASTQYVATAEGDEAVAKSTVDVTVVPRNRLSCKTLKQQDPSLANGTYKLNSGNFFCEMSTDGGGWTRVRRQYFSGQSNGPTRSDMYPAVNTFKNVGASQMMIHLGNRWFVMEGLTHSEFAWMWNSGHGHEARHVASRVRTSIGKTWSGSSVTWQHWNTEIYELNANGGSWDRNVIFDLGYDSNHGPAFWDNGNGIYKRAGGYQSPYSGYMNIYVR